MPLGNRLQRFKKVEYEKNKDYYQSLKYAQDPHTLFIACSDSRIDAERLMNAKPGEVFHLRNIANIVTPQDEMTDYPSMISTIEFGVKVLDVENIVVCGHSNCGGCAALMDLESNRENLPITAKWLEPSLPIKEEIVKRYGDLPLEEQLQLLEKANAIKQLDHLMTYPFISEKVEKGSLDIYALHYDIGSGQILEYKYDSHMPDFITLVDNLTVD